MQYSIFPLTLSLLLSTSLAQAEVTFPQPRAFQLDQACSAYTSLKKQNNPEALTVGQSYTAVSENKQPGATHTLLQLQGQRKWVELRCGHYTDAAPEANPTPMARGETEACLPFFDNINNPVKLKIGGPVDITPPAPTLNAFDQAVDTVCGQPGKSVSPAEFKALMQQHPDVLQRIQAFTENRVFAERPAKTSSADYLNDLTEAWFAVKAFDHIMCGEPEAGGPIGGMHFIGRYLQLQQSGQACRMANYRQNEVVDGVLYSMGAIMKLANGGVARSSIKGYGLTLNAEDILKAATRAFTEDPTPNTDSTACLLPVSDGGHRFTSVFVRRANGIRTFYPDGSPNPREKVCTQAIRVS